MGILAGKRILVTGVITDASIAFHVARVAQQEGASVVLTGFGRLSLVERIAKRLPDPPPVLELDVTSEEHLDSLAERLSAHVDGLDGVLHAIAYANPEEALGGNFLRTRWADVATAVQVSAYSLKAVTVAALPLMGGGGSVVGLDFDASVAWPGYDWMGVAKAGLESCARYLARDLGPKGVRVNLVAAGPLRTMAAKSIPGFDRFEGVWGDRAPLGWKITDPEPVARACVALLSDWFPATTGEIVHVDGPRPAPPPQAARRTVPPQAARPTASTSSPCPARTASASSTRSPRTCTRPAATCWTASSSATGSRAGFSCGSTWRACSRRPPPTRTCTPGSAPWRPSSPWTGNCTTPRSSPGC